jgi:hypothetical protein
LRFDETRLSLYSPGKIPRHDPGKVGTGFPIRIMPNNQHDPGKVGTGFPIRIMRNKITGSANARPH